MGEVKRSAERTLTINRGEHHPGVVVGDDVSVAILWLVDLHVGILPGELLARIDGLHERGMKEEALEKDTGGEGERDEVPWGITEENADRHIDKCLYFNTGVK